MATQKKPSAMTAQPSTPSAMANASLMARVAGRYGVDPDKMNNALKQTAFRQRAKDGKPPAEVSNEQMLMLMVIADQYKLNPFTREIYAFPSEQGIVAIVGVDGWIRIINERPELKAISFDFAEPEAAEYWVKCTIERHDRNKPISVIEYLSENQRNTKPWADMPRRMLRHRALIQCARVAFGFGGIHDPDEGERIVSVVEQPTRAKIQQPRTINERSPDLISVDQMTVLMDKVKEEGIDMSLFLASFQLDNIEDLPAERYTQALAAIDKLSADAK